MADKDLPNSILQGSIVVLLMAFVLHITISSIYHLFSHDQGPHAKFVHHMPPPLYTERMFAKQSDSLAYSLWACVDPSNQKLNKIQYWHILVNL